MGADSLRMARQIALCLLLATCLAACSTKSKKLSSGGSAADSFFYDILGADRGTDYYYQVLRGAYDTKRFCYRCTSDPFLVDKAIDAVYHLGGADYARLEGQAQVVSLLCDVLLEDPSPLAQSQAANSLTRLAIRLPRYPPSTTEDDGRLFLAYLRELDGMHDAEHTALRPDLISNPAAANTRMAQLIAAIGGMEMADLSMAKDTLRPFFSRNYLIDATDPAVRQAIDTALVRRIGDVTRMSLIAAVDAQGHFVREEAIRGLKVLGENSAVPAVLARLQIESSPRVRAEGVEFLGAAGGTEAVGALLPLLDDGDLTVRFKAREALVRIARQDLGTRRRAWTRWARATYPQLEVEEEDAGGSGQARPG